MQDKWHVRPTLRVRVGVGATIFTDGSRKYVTDPEIAVAASAAVQITVGGEKATATLAISSEFPRSAVVAEHMALYVASYFSCPGAPITRASDCQAVVQGAGKDNETRMNYRRKMGGFWAMIGNNIDRVFKVKAHLTRQEAADRNEQDFHAGNELADHCANQALPKHNEEELRLYLQTNGRTRKIAEATDALIRADNGSPSLNGIEKTYTRRHRAKASNKFHTYQWCSNLHKWVCSSCGAVSLGARAPVQGKAGCRLTVNLLAVAHTTHRLFRAHLEDSGLALFYCGKCACYTQTRSTGLTRPCAGKPTSAVRKRLLLNGRHPVNDVAITGHMRVLSLSQIQDLWPTVLGADAVPGPAGAMAPVPGRHSPDLFSEDRDEDFESYLLGIEF